MNVVELKIKGNHKLDIATIKKLVIKKDTKSDCLISEGEKDSKSKTCRIDIFKEGLQSSWCILDFEIFAEFLLHQDDWSYQSLSVSILKHFFNTEAPVFTLCLTEYNRFFNEFQKAKNGENLNRNKRLLSKCPENFDQLWQLTFADLTINCSHLKFSVPKGKSTWSVINSQLAACARSVLNYDSIVKKTRAELLKVDCKFKLKDSNDEDNKSEIFTVLLNQVSGISKDKARGLVKTFKTFNNFMNELENNTVDSFANIQYSTGVGIRARNLKIGNLSSRIYQQFLPDF